VLACASLCVTTLASEAARRGGGKSSHAVTSKSAKHAARKAGKAKRDKSVSGKPALQVPLAKGPPPQTAESEVALVKSALDGLRSGGAGKATSIAAGISDPVARKLVEWIILNSDNNGVASKRYLAFIAANPSWPSLARFFRRAEALLWVENPPPVQVQKFFNGTPPQSGVGRLVLARALLAQGDTEGASALIREAWRNEALTAETEKQALELYSKFLSTADHKARMEKRLFAADNDAALRMARRLGGADLAVAQARIALERKGVKATAKDKEKNLADARKLLATVPAEARNDPGYIFARMRVLRRGDKTAEATQALLSAPTDLAVIHDPEEWWVERRIMARKLLDLGDHRSAYRVVAEGADPTKENSRVERHFMAGWIALRFLDEPATAAPHFARIPDVSNHPTSRARSHYWLGRVAEALRQPERARAEYEAAARSSASYYGQLARARLGLRALELAEPPPTPDKGNEAARLDQVRALEILYALDERKLAIAFMARLGESLNDVGTLSALGELAEKVEDARGMLHLGKGALARGLPLDYYAFPAVGVPRYSPIGPGIDKAMLFAIIRQESAFDPADWSHAQAMGLMQVTPEAGRHTCKLFGCKYDVKRLKSDIPYNLQVGAAELGGLLEEYRGNLVMVFAGYNAGRGRVRDWVARFGDPRDPKVDPIDWVERIPFMETRNYVQRVMENLQVYRARFDDDKPFTIEADLGRDRRRDAAAK
jgi:soluble lytic murein transglycosylase